MNIDSVRDIALSKPGVEECFPFGPDTLVYKVAGKIFLFIGLNTQPLGISVKCDPDKALQLREQYPSVTPAYHLNKKHWNGIVIDGSIPKNEIREWIDESYDLVAPKPKKRSNGSSNR